MSKKSLELNDLFLSSLKQLHKKLKIFFGPKKKTLANLAYVIILMAILCVMIWWNWDKIANLPGVDRVISWYNEKPLPQVDPNYFTVLVTHLENDKEREIENLIIHSLIEKEKGIHIRLLDRNIIVSDVYPEKNEQKGQEQARIYLQKTGAQVLIWGTVIKGSGKSLPKLYWTIAENLQLEKTFERYQPTENLSLPVIFWEDLADILRLLILTNYTQFHTSQGKYISDNEIKSFIGKLSRVLKYHKGKPGWSDREYARAMLILANSLSICSEQSGKNEPLEEAILAYREALKEFTRERVPLDWATTQNNLGTTFSILGERESGTKHLEEALAAYREALKEFTRERVPLDWAETQNNMGSTLSILGERENGTKHLEEAVAAYREALKEYTRERVLLYWSMAQNGLNRSLETINKRKDKH